MSVSDNNRKTLRKVSWAKRAGRKMSHGSGKSITTVSRMRYHVQKPHVRDLAKGFLALRVICHSVVRYHPLPSVFSDLGIHSSLLTSSNLSSIFVME
jgi:hypothetical protein